MAAKTSAPITWTLSIAALLLAVAHLLGYTGEGRHLSKTDKPHAVCDPNIIYRQQGLPPLRARGELGALLESRRLETGAEVGVQAGYHSQLLLSQWKSCTQFYLIDMWKQQENYIDSANADNNEQERLFQHAQGLLREHQNKTTFLRMSSVEAAQQLESQSLDFVYIDARHDFCGVTEDLRAYWPKLRPGGILAGHDFMNAADVRPGQDWSVCADGSKHEGAVRGAVEEFAAEHGLVVSVMYAEGGVWASWMTQKPTIPECVEHSKSMVSAEAS